jgi:peptidoglycan/xylan/chitin deacetylase (PgdA/CDA1 family)
MRFIHLTIDDAPSTKTVELIDYLKRKKIGAILFCRGDYLKERRRAAVGAVHDGYIIGNHSYSHPHFSTLTAEQAKTEIMQTDRIIGEIYVEAGLERPAKYFRFPYGDAGTTTEAIKKNQQLLRELGYWSPVHSPRRDWKWDVDVEDYRVDASNATQKLKLAKARLKALRPGDVLDLHDYAVNFEMALFQRICDFVLELGFIFYSNDHLQQQSKHRI